MPDDFYLAAVPEPATLLGLKLLPFSLGHNLLLHRAESAFVTGERVTYEDLALSVFICAQSYAEALCSFNNPELPSFMRRWHAKLTGDFWWRRLFKLKITPVALREKSEQFSKYMEEGSRMPYYDVPLERLRECSIETIQVVQLALMSKTTLTESELMDRPWGRCLFDYVGLLAMEDKVTIRDKSAFREAQDIGNRIMEKLNKGGNGLIQSHS